MDPNELMRELIELASANCEDRHAILFESMQRAGEAFLELDEWFGKGGFTPSLWAVKAAPKDVVDYAKAQALSNSGRDLLAKYAAKFIACDGCCSTRTGIQFFKAFLKFHGLLVGGCPLPSVWAGELPT